MEICPIALKIAQSWFNSLSYIKLTHENAQSFSFFTKVAKKLANLVALLSTYRVWLAITNSLLLLLKPQIDPYQWSQIATYLILKNKHDADVTNTTTTYFRYLFNNFVALPVWPEFDQNRRNFATLATFL